MSALIAWLLGNPTILAIIGGILAMLGWGVARERAGAKKERAKQDKATLDALKQQKEIRDEVDALAPADLDARFDRWMRDKP